MPGRSFTIQLSTTTSCPGDVFDVELEPQDIDTLRSGRTIVVELVCRHDYRSVEMDPNRVSYVRQEIALDNGDPATRSVRLEIPHDAPISFSGKLIRNQWSIEVSLDIARARDVELANSDVLVVPRNGTERWSSPHPLR